jgi:hypothetical protein
VLEVGEEKLTALKSTFLFQRDFLPEGNVMGRSSLKVPMHAEDWAFSKDFIQI